MSSGYGGLSMDTALNDPHCSHFPACHPYDSVMPDYSGCCFASIPCLLGGPPQNKATAFSLYHHTVGDVAVVQVFPEP